MNASDDAGPSATTRRLRVAWWCVLLLVCLGAWGARPLWDTDETRYALVAHNMVATGDWFTPMLHGAPHMTKPPITYWLAGAAMAVFGRNEWAARLPVVLASLATALSVGALARTWFGDELRARLAAVVFATSLLACATGHTLSTDMLLTCFEALAVLAAWRAWRGGGAAWRWVCAGAFALAFLTKGPPGLVPLGVLAVFAALRAPDPRRGRLFSWPAFVAAVALSVSWYVLQIQRDPELLRFFLGREFVDRIATTDHSRDKPVWFYFVVLPGGALPWTLLWPRVAGALRARLRTARAVAAGAGVLATLRALDERVLFLLLWLVPAFVLFQVSGAKMPYYVTPLLVPLSLAVTPIAATALRAVWERGGARRTVLVAAGAVFVGTLFTANAAPPSFVAERNFVAAGRAARAALPPGQEKVYGIGLRPDSFTWVSGLEIEKLLHKNTDAQRARFVAARAAEAGVVLLLLEPDKLDLFDKLPVALHDLARNEAGVLVEVRPR